MNRIATLARKYRQAPWRIQRQWLGLILLGVTAAAMVAGVYLNVTARATLAGREILDLNAEIAANRRANADLQTKLAQAGSEASMRERARALGFIPADSNNIVYVVVPGYAPKRGVDLSTAEEEPPASILRPEYRQTLLEWFAERIRASSPGSGGWP